MQNSFTAEAEIVRRLLEDSQPPEMLLPLGASLSYSVPLCQVTICQILYEQRQAIFKRNNFRELRHVLLVIFAPAKACAQLA